MLTRPQLGAPEKEVMTSETQTPAVMKWWRASARFQRTSNGLTVRTVAFQ